MTDLLIDADLPAGNILIDRREDNTVFLRPELRDTQGHWFYWKFRVVGAAGQRLRFQFPSQEGLCLGARGPAFSLDQGHTWTWLGAEHCGIPDDESFEFSFPSEAQEVWFCTALPYLLSDWERFLSSLDRPLERDVLCLGRKGREVPLLRLPGQPDAPRVVITARHHCCESSPGFLLEGLLTEWNCPAALTVIPFVDLDGCEDGDQGKKRNGRDHNRDYLPDAMYPETRAIMALLEAEERPFMALDLHCPYIRNDLNDTLYIVGGADPVQAERQRTFSDLLREHANGLPYHPEDNVPYGTLWNTKTNYQEFKPFGRWAWEQPGCFYSCTFEIPYSTARATEVTPDRLRTFGQSLARTVNTYLKLAPQS